MQVGFLRIFIFVLVLSLQSTNLANAAIKEGSRCSAIGQISGKYSCVSLNGKKFWHQLKFQDKSDKYVWQGQSCGKKGMIARGYIGFNGLKNLICSIDAKNPNNLIWSELNPVQRVTVSSLPQSNSVCNFDPNSPKEWIEIEKFLALGSCASFFKYVPYTLSISEPKSAITNSAELTSISECKVKQPSRQTYPWRGFVDQSDSWMVSYFERKTSPRPRMKIQAVPIMFPEFDTTENPAIPYERYFKFIKEWVENSSDIGSEVTYDIPKKYIMMPKKFSEYKDVDLHGQPTPDRDIFWRDVVTAADPEIDFRNVSLSLVLVPPQIPLDKFSMNPDGRGQTQEGEITSMITVPPLNLSLFGKNTNFLGPNMLLHQMSHAGIDIGDYYFAGIWPSVGNGVSDQLMWDKYIEGFLDDSQVRCASPEKTSTHWIIPSMAKKKLPKLVVIPLSKTKVIVVESVKAAGYRYKLPKSEQGALVYSVDVTITKHGEGTDVYTPNRSKPSLGSSLLDATLKMGESVTVSGVKISVVETGDFGDVIKVEKA